MPSTQKNTNYTNCIMQNNFFLNIGKKIKNQIFKLLNYKYLLIERKYVNIKKNQIIFVQNQKIYICLLPLCDLST